MKMEAYPDNPRMKPSVLLTGAANECHLGPALGRVDIGTNDDAFIFRVSLPGIRNNNSNLKCEILCDGTVNIRGSVSNVAGILRDSSQVFKMRVQQLPPDGPFGISFKLPGPVDPRLFCPNLRADGILEGVIMRCENSQNAGHRVA